jgi:hypothetical protein
MTIPAPLPAVARFDLNVFAFPWKVALNKYTAPPSWLAELESNNTDEKSRVGCPWA